MRYFDVMINEYEAVLTVFFDFYWRIGSKIKKEGQFLLSLPKVRSV